VFYAVIRDAETNDELGRIALWKAVPGDTVDLCIELEIDTPDNSGSQD
jgi:hypothetical protein